MEYYEVEEPMPYCPRCEAPWVGEHEIQLAAETEEEPSPLYWVQRRSGPTEDCPEGADDFLGWSRDEAERRLSQLADAESCRGLWQDYERRHRSRALLDVGSDTMLDSVAAHTRPTGSDRAPNGPSDKPPENSR